jgi:hypothetical protein
MTDINLNIVYESFLDVKVSLPDGVAWSDVSDWYVKWDTIILILGDNTIHKVSWECCNDDYVVETKHPSYVTIEDTSGELLDEA